MCDSNVASRLPHSAPAALTEIVDRLLCSRDPATQKPSRYERRDEGTELLKDSLYRYQLVELEQRRVSLQVFTNLHGLGGQLWEQTVRVLLRVNSLGHPALPEILDGGFDSDHNIGYVLTDSPDSDLKDPGALPFLGPRKLESLRQFGMLCDALSVLHGQGMSHRNIVPESIEFLRAAGARPMRLRLARFEMSMLVGNLLRRDYSGDEASRGDHAIGRLADARAAVYTPPERISALSAPRSALLESDRSDVYSLGVLGWELFVGDLSEEIGKRKIDPAGLDLSYLPELRAHMQSEITRNKQLSTSFQKLLRGMLENDPRTRWTSKDVVEELVKNYHGLAASFETRQDDKPYVVAFMPDESGPTVFKWKWILHDPHEIEGKSELASFLETELKGATLVYSPDGADRFLKGVKFGDDREARRAACYVLLGIQGAWFCVQYREETAFGVPGQLLDDVLLIKYVVPKYKARALDQAVPRKRIPSVTARSWELLGPQGCGPDRRGRPSWRPLLDAIRVEEQITIWRTNFESAIDWFLSYQRAELDARQYPFVLESQQKPSAMTALIRYDRGRDERRIAANRSPLLAMFASNPRRRPCFGDFFDDLVETEDAGRLSFCPANDDAPPRWDRRSDAFFCERLDDDVIKIRRREGSGNFPPSGWVRPQSDSGSEVVQKRQIDAVPELLATRGLLSQLEWPRKIQGARDRWPDESEHVKEMLSSQVFYALHGPPGTGKTTVAAGAINAFLRTEHGARILVSAQSNFSLDNLAVRVLKQIEGKDVIAIRLTSSKGLRTNDVDEDASEGDDRVRKEIKDITLDALIPNLAARIAEHCKERLGRGRESVPIRAIFGEWKAAVGQNQLELYDRIRRGANLVFATCSTATKRNIDAFRGFGIYDWVIIEEAAKAWPTELAIPLVRGYRWTLIGDYMQLPAHKLDEIMRFLLACNHSPDEELRAHALLAEEYEKVFKLFGDLFERFPPQNPAQPDPAAIHRTNRALGRLTRQYRMREPIARVVSRAFYSDDDDPEGEGYLITDPSTERDSGITAPHQLAGRALVWLDTQGLDWCRDERRKNKGEARIVAALLEQMRPNPLEIPPVGEEDRLAILSPYRKQLDEELASADLPEGCKECLFSIHQYQGREAGVVIASLVRDTVRGNQPYENLGYLTHEELINVLLSRAKRLLVIVGRFAHFRQSGVPFWENVCQGVERYGCVVPAADVVELD
jgi:serine/threonine protein kinase